MFTTLVLICSMAVGADLRDCNRTNPLVFVQVPDGDAASRSCLMHRPPDPVPGPQHRRKITT